MQCPHCQTENRNDRATCYHCGKDLVLLRLMVNRARGHYNAAVAHARDQRPHEALRELAAAIELDGRFVEAHVLRGSLLARMERLDEAREALDRALSLNPTLARAHRFLGELPDLQAAMPMVRRVRSVMLGAGAVAALALAIGGAAVVANRDPLAAPIAAGWTALAEGHPVAALDIAATIDDPLRQRPLMQAALLGVEQQFQMARDAAAAGRSDEAAALLTAVESAAGSNHPAVTRSAAKLKEALAANAAARHEAAHLADDALDAAALAQFEAGAAAIESAWGAPALMAPARARLAARVARRWNTEAEKLADPDAFGEVAARLRAFRTAAPAVYTAGLDEATIDRWQSLHAEATRRMVAIAAEAGDLEGIAAIAPRAAAFGVDVAPARAAAATRLLEAALADGDNMAIARAARRVIAHGAAIPKAHAARVDQARRQAATTAYHELMAMADAVDAAPAPDAKTAARLLELVELIRDGPPERLRMRAEENAAWYAARALTALGREDEAAREIARLREQFPRSPYLTGVVGGS